MSRYIGNFWAHVEKTDDCWLWRGLKLPGGYGLYRDEVGAPAKSAHRVAWELDSRKKIPPGLLVDHTCFNRLCVRPSHLRLATAKQNAENQRGARRDSSTGRRGVSFDGQKYVVKVTHNGKTRQYGRFDDLDDATDRAIEVRRELFSHNDVDRI